ncbi:MAG: hypothetical protein K9H41_05750 [Bacteroidia bacterium]|nr:hypothetical protein [Bacteroidia bacterium]
MSLQKATVYLYFFFNSIGLKGGLLYTNLLTPFFLIWIYKKGLIKSVIYPVLIILPFSIIHFCMGVDFKTFIISHVLVLSTIIFVVASYIYISRFNSLKEVMRKILLFNFILVLIAIPFYFMDDEYQKIFWYTNLFTTQKIFTRLALFTFEASYYSLLLIPLIYYFLFKIGFSKTVKNNKTVLIMVLLPLLLSMSFGVIGGTIISAFLMAWFNRDLFIKHKILFNLISAFFILFILSIIILFALFPASLPVVRISNIFTGYDTSSRGRTIEAFQIAWLVADSKSIWFGCGLGQAKLLLPEIIHKYFSHWGNSSVYRIPNTLAETLAIFGIAGIVIRFAIIIYLFFKTNVNTNFLRLSLFLFIFIYQFTGSYITNVVEYVIWIFAFTNVFPEFDVSRSQLKHKSLT